MNKDPGSEAQTERGTLAALGVFVERPTLVMLPLGFAAGLPNLLIFDTLSAWLREAGLSLEVIGFFSLATLAYSFKFLWAPMVDRTRVPLLTAWLGHRRSWMLVCQALIMLGLWLVAGSDPAGNLALVALFAVFVGFASATQDIVIDAWRIEAAEVSKQGAMATAYQWGYRIAMIVAGAAPLFLAQAFDWHVSYGVMALLMAVGMAAVLAAPREAQHAIRAIETGGLPRAPLREAGEWILRLAVLAIGALLLGSGLAGRADALAGALSAMGWDDAGAQVTAAWQSANGIWFQFLSVLAGAAVIVAAVLPLPRIRTRPGVYLGSALGDPLKDFFARYGRTAAAILALICLYRVSDFVLNIMNPFYLDLGFTLGEIAEVRKVFGVVMAMAGVFIGGFAVAKLGLMRALVIGAFAGPLSNLVFIWLATRGNDLFALFLAIGIDNVASGFAGTCLIAYMSSLTAEGFTATQYALFSSLYALPGKLIASQSGRIVEGAAHWAESGGMFAPLTALFAHLPAESFAAAMEKSGVSPEALGAGYTVFFLYSTAIGVAAILLAYRVAGADARARRAGARGQASPNLRT